MPTRTRNGFTDDGTPLPSPSACPACRSPSFVATLSRESCASCGYEVDYWGGGANDVALAHDESERHREIQERIDREWMEDQKAKDEYLNQKYSGRSGWPYDE